MSTQISTTRISRKQRRALRDAETTAAFAAPIALETVVYDEDPTGGSPSRY